MHAKPINEILAENLAYFMSERGLKQTAMGLSQSSTKIPSISSLSAAARQLFSFKHNR